MLVDESEAINQGAYIYPCRFVLVRKRNGRYKARWVLRGDHQIFDEPDLDDYDDDEDEEGNDNDEYEDKTEVTENGDEAEVASGDGTAEHGGAVEEIETDGSRESIEGHAGEVQRSLNIETGPVMRVALLRCGESDRLLVTAHHLVVDGVSWRILLEDLQRLLVEGLEADLGGKTTSYVRWAEHLASYAGSMELEDELGYWEDRPEFVLPRDGDGPNTVAEAVSVKARLTQAEVSRIQEAAEGDSPVKHNMVTSDNILGISLLHAEYHTFPLS